MERTIGVVIKDKVASCSGARYICGNSDYIVQFEFDDEWSAFEVKTARFKWKTGHIDVTFSGTVCAVPIITGVELFSVGVYAGNLCTTTPAYVRADKSILCGDSVPADPPPDVYVQIMDTMNSLVLQVQSLTHRVEALEQGGGGSDSTSAVLGIAMLGRMKLA